jgi:hypothetical protein
LHTGDGGNRSEDDGEGKPEEPTHFTIVPLGIETVVVRFGGGVHFGFGPSLVEPPGPSLSISWIWSSVVPWGWLSGRSWSGGVLMSLGFIVVSCLM